VVELANPGGEEFGRFRLERLVRECLHLSAASVVEEVKRATIDFRAEPAYEDDFTLMVVKRQPCDIRADADSRDSLGSR
jgi:serine phosphatase RsbU (regulator of sigma subunit)